MTVTEIRSILEAPYNRTVWKDFIKTQFTNNQLTKDDYTLQLGKSDLYTECYSLGNYAVDDFTKIGIFEIQLATKVNLSRNRVALRNLIKEVSAQVAGAMVVFVQDDKWRFSYISKRKVKNKNTNQIEDKETAPKRYTYLFGKGEKALTASIRFDNLIQKQQSNIFQNLELNDFEDAFSVEKLSKDFFNEYKKIYDDFVEFITGKRYVKKGSKFIETQVHEAHFQLRNYFDGDEKLARDFFKRMMGRIVFLYFIQKKGWLSVAKGKNWGEGNPDYLFELYKKAKYKDSFYSDYLVPLFFDTLNNSEVQKESNEFRFPYLNGGLFDKEQDYRYNKIALPAEIFEKLFNTFNNFNFTVYEDAPDEHTVAVDPEMLGHIFENLLEDNKDKGAFYTPKDIVHYMCRESLHNYIYTYTQNTENEDFKRKLKQYNDNYDLTIFNSSEIKQIDRALEDVKICDPAIGSGAFPMGLLHEIYHLKIPIEDAKGLKAKSPADLKKHIIEESIYGVDIDNGAVDIARLRFWLSLVVDETEPQPLPNLAFKIVCANTLIPLGMDNKINIAGATEVVLEIEKVRENYFDSSKEVKKDLERHFKNLQNKLWATAKDWITTKEAVLYQKLLEFNPFEDKSCTWFDAWWMFGVKDGFDIVIGNPPYVQVKQIEPHFKKVYQDIYKFATGRFNLFYFFLEISKKLTKKEGITSYIIPDRLMLNTQCVELRSWLLNEQTIIEIVSFGEAVFENAVVDSIILSYKNKPNLNDFIIAKSEVSIIDLTIKDGIKIPVTYFVNSPNNQFDLNYSISKSEIFEQLIKNTVQLGSISETRDGIIQSKIPDILFLTEKENKHCEKLLYGRDISKYELNYNNNWVNYQPEEMMKIELERGGGGLRLRVREIFETTKILTRQTADSIIATVDYDNHFYANTLHGTIIKDDKYDIKFVLALLNSSVLKYYYRQTTSEGGKVFAQVKIEILRQMPIKVTNELNQIPFINVVDYLLYLHNNNSEQIFSHSTNDRLASNIEEVLNMMVYELYFEEHMKQNDLDVLQFIQPKPIDNLDNDTDKVEVIKNFYLWLQTADNKVRQRINSIDIKSPDILSVINSATK